MTPGLCTQFLQHGVKQKTTVQNDCENSHLLLHKIHIHTTNANKHMNDITKSALESQCVIRTITHLHP